MNTTELKARTKQFALRSFRLIEALPQCTSASIISRQLGRSASAVGANYRAACRSRSKKEFIAKLGIVEEEADESAYWLEIIIESELIPQNKAEPLLKEANELTAIFIASIKSARAHP